MSALAFKYLSNKRSWSPVENAVSPCHCTACTPGTPTYLLALHRKDHFSKNPVTDPLVFSPFGRGDPASEVRFPHPYPPPNHTAGKDRLGIGNQAV